MYWGSDSGNGIFDDGDNSNNCSCQKAEDRAENKGDLWMKKRMDEIAGFLIVAEIEGVDLNE